MEPSLFVFSCRGAHHARDRELSQGHMSVSQKRTDGFRGARCHYVSIDPDDGVSNHEISVFPALSRI